MGMQRRNERKTEQLKKEVESKIKKQTKRQATERDIHVSCLDTLTAVGRHMHCSHLYEVLEQFRDIYYETGALRSK
jgi:hypothetical protein